MEVVIARTIVTRHLDRHLARQPARRFDTAAGAVTISGVSHPEGNVDEELLEVELVDAELVPELPAVAAPVAIAPARWSEHPTVQAAAAAATGFVAGAATLALMQRYGLRRVARHLPELGGAIDPSAGRLRGPVAGTGPGQTYIVYVRAVSARVPE
jgi:hypothetical protein